MAGAYFSMCSLIFLIIFIINFFSKENFKSKETSLYRLLLIITFFGTLLDVLGFILYKCNYNINSFLYKTIAKSMLVYFNVWIILFTSYAYTISEKYIIKIKSNIFLIISVITSLIIISFPIYFEETSNAVFPYGIGVTITYLIVGICLIVNIVLTLENSKDLILKKYAPIFLIIVMIAASTIIQKFFPDLFLINFSLTIIVVVMYFTIENPDVKVLEEVHKAKEISDNANEEKTMFLYNMTNDIRKITKEIDTASDSILKEIDNKKIDSNLIGDYTRDIKNSTAKFTTMTNEILDISQIDSANIRIYNDKYNIKLIIKEMIQKYKDVCLKKNLDFRTSIASDIPDYLYGDSVSLKKALTIILDNSVKYTSDGYVEFSVNTIMRRDVCRLIISIEDSGIGIKADDLAKVFSKKEEDTEKDRHNLDNNLYNAKRLITLMNGTIIPSSVYDKGTTIKVVLDQKVASTDTSGLNKYEEVYDEKKILLVDDNESSTKIISKMLSGTNIKLDTVSLGSECLTKIRNKEKYDLILLEEDMKPLDGITVMKKLQSIRSFNIKVILLTHNNDYEYNDDYQKYGFSDYILKPINKDKLLDKINKHLE